MFSLVVLYMPPKKTRKTRTPKKEKVVGLKGVDRELVNAFLAPRLPGVPVSNQPAYLGPPRPSILKAGVPMPGLPGWMYPPRRVHGIEMLPHHKWEPY